jgi:Domain of unknown function (DUF4157)/NAD:arginine ADP-ribosyltransferase
MYKPLQKHSQVMKANPTKLITNQKQSGIVLQPKGLETPELQPDTPKYNSVAAEKLAAKVLDNIAVPRTEETFPKLGQLVQAKLTIGQPGDKYEQEADRVAAQVVQKINAPVSVQAEHGQSVQRQEQAQQGIQAKPEITSLQRRSAKEDEELQMSTLQPQEAIGGEASTDFASAINRAKGGGQPLDAGLQRSIGQAMGADFSGVKVHTDSQSDQLNQSIQAKAFTTGQDVFFRQGAYQPGSIEGQELIAHELTHVVQQNANYVQREQDNHIAQENTQSKGDFDYEQKNILQDGLVQLHSEDTKVMRKGDKDKDDKTKQENELKLKNSIEFERNLGVHAFKHPKANAAVDEMNNKMVEAMIPEFQLGVEEHHQKLVSLFSRSGSADKVRKSAGQVSPKFEVILEMLLNGNLREKMTALMNAMFGSFKQEALQGMSESAWDRMEAQGLNVEKLKRRKKQMKFNLGAKDIFRDPGNPLDRKNFKTWEHTSGAREANDESERGSKRTVKELDNLGIGLSDREKQFMYGDKLDNNEDIQNERLLWEEGGTYWKINQNDKWVKKVQNKLHMPVIAGPSGTALRTFQIWEYLSKPVPAEDMRLALLGWMLTSNDHSFHEIMLTSSEFGGLSYKAGLDAYHNIPPLTEDELRANVAVDGAFPGEWNYQNKIINNDFNMVTEEQIETMEGLINKGSKDFVTPLTKDWQIAAALAVLVYTDENPSAYKFINNVLNSSESKLKMHYFLKQDRHLAPLYEANKFNIKSIIGEAKEHAKMVELGLKLLKPYTGNVYRGYKAWSLPKKGDNISDNKFFSTSADENTAKNFANKGIGRYKIIVSIKSKTGRKLGNVSMIGNSEEEVLFPPGTKFTISSVPVQRGDYYYVDWQEQ